MKTENLVILICANGAGVRWGHHQDTPKPLVEIMDVPLIHRAILLLENLQPGCGTYVIGRDGRLVIPPARLLPPAAETYNPLPGYCFGESFPMMADRGADYLVVMGDIFWTFPGVCQLAGLPDEGIQFFGHADAERRHSPEIFGVRVPGTLLGRWHELLDQARRKTPRGVSCGWGAYYLMMNISPKQHRVTTNWTEIVPEVVDIDSPTEYRDLQYVCLKNAKVKRNGTDP